MTQKSSLAGLVFAWTMFARVLGLAASVVLSPLIWPGRPTAVDLARGEALIRRQYSSAQMRVGRVSLAAAANCAMRGSAELVDAEDDSVRRRAECVVTIFGKDGYTATCR